MKNPYRQFTLRVLALAGLAVLAVGLLNIIIDPYNYFGINTLGVYISAEREAKASQILAYPHDAFLIGNSRAAMIPVSALRGYHFYNAAFGGARVEEIYHFIDRFAHGQKLILLSIDLGACDAGPIQGDPFAHSFNSALDKTLNLQCLEYSIRTISSHLTRQPTHMAKDGSFNPGRWFELYDRENPAAMNWALNDEIKRYDSWRPCPPEAMNYFWMIAQILRDRKIPCVVFIPPIHENLVQHIKSSVNYPLFLEWKRTLTSIFPRVMDFSFGPYSNPENFFKTDPVHFKPEAGVMIINHEILSKVLSDQAAKIGSI